MFPLSALEANPIALLSALQRIGCGIEIEGSYLTAVTSLLFQVLMIYFQAAKRLCAARVFVN